jgi:hypothetical protein
MIQRLGPTVFLALTAATMWGYAARAQPVIRGSESAEAGQPLPPVSPPPAPRIGQKTNTKIIPLPIYATLPNEGSTFGFMPVFLVVDPDTAKTQSIYAPSISWNRVIDWTGTFRWYHYPSEDQALTVTASGSTHVNYGGLLIWEDLPKGAGQYTETAFVRFGRSIFFRFFGLGPDSKLSDETSNTRVRADLWYRRGWNLSPYFNIGPKIEYARDVVQSQTAPGFLSSTAVFPDAPGMSGGAILAESIDFRYDTRQNRDYSAHGQYADFEIGPVQGIVNGDSHWQATLEAKTLFEETERLTGGARLYWRYVTSPNVPFYYQSSLGGSFLMRGLIDDRFIDQGAWTAEFEQRIRLFQTHIYGVTADWRVDPFVAVGQVFHPGTGLFSRVRVAEGLGFRAWVRPNVLGRVDMAYAREGVNFYVEIGYPF